MRLFVFSKVCRIALGFGFDNRGYLQILAEMIEC